MQNINYKLIEVARNSRKMSQRELSLKLPKLNQQNLSKVERGEIPVSEESIKNIAKALDFPVDFFCQQEIKTPLSNIYFRKRATLPTKELDKIFADVKIILQAIDHLLEFIELKEYPKFCFDINEGWTTDSIASRLREIMQIHPDKPVENVITKIEELGVIVVLYNSSHDKFDGLTAYTDRGVPVIFVNSNMSNERKKFTVIHELSHLVTHIPCNIEPWRNYENEANSITSAFYLPEKYVSRDLLNLNYYKLGEIKTYWGVSKSMIIRRAKDLNIISPETYTYLNIELGRRGERLKEEGYVHLDKPQIIETIIDLLKNEGFTLEKLAKETRLSINDYVRLFDKSNSVVKLRVI